MKKMELIDRLALKADIKKRVAQYRHGDKPMPTIEDIIDEQPTITDSTIMADGYWYHGNGKPMGEFCHIKLNDKERYGEYVKVVRCKDCKWIDLCKDPKFYEYKGANGFCSKGKRKDEAEE